MSVRVIAIVLKQSEARMGARLVLLALADSAHDSGVTWASQEALAAKTLMHRGSVNRALKELEAAGEIEVRKAQRGKLRINVYRIALHGIHAPSDDDIPFALDYPFTTSQVTTSQESHDVTEHAATTSQSVQGTALVLSLGVNRKGNRKKDLPTDVGAREIVGHFVDETKALGGAVPGRVKGQVAKLVGELLKEGIGPAQVTAGVDLMVERRLHPSTLPSCVNEASMPRRPPPRGRSDGRMTAEQIMAQAIQHRQEGR